MSYQVLARKWRPDSFESIVGQSHVVRALSHALDQQRIHHAYLFTGTRGVGKTTLGRILAKCLNCDQGISAKPCGQCHSCQEIATGRFIDLIEVDAASRTKVEDTRELLENIPYAPTRGRFKVYLIDEVHMLSTHSFNALLKTLEEPPAHVKFFLATTDPQKLPITVLSRCLQFHLKCLSVEQMTQRLAYILQQEKISYEEAALPRLAHVADGSMRDALSLLDQAIAYGQGSVSDADIKSMLGTIESDYIYAMLTALAHQQADVLIALTQQLADRSIDFNNALEELLSLLHHIAIAQFTHTKEVGTWDQAQITHFAKIFSAENIQLFYQIALIGRKDLPLAPTPRMGLEMVLLRMLAFQPNKLPQQKSPVISAAKERDRPIEKDNTDSDQWQTILSKLNLSGMTAAIAHNCTLCNLTESEITLAIDPAQLVMLNKKQEERLGQALQSYFQRPLRLVIQNGQPNLVTPALLDKQEKIKQKTAARAAIEQDSNVKMLIDTFNATLLPDSTD